MHAYKWRKWCCKWSHSSSVTSSNQLVRLQVKKRWAGALLSVKCWCFVQKRLSTQFWTSQSEQEENHFGLQVTFWFGMFAMLFWATGRVVYHENTRRWTVRCYQVQVYRFWDFESLFCIIIYCVSMLSLHIESINSMIDGEVATVHLCRFAWCIGLATQCWQCVPSAGTTTINL